MSAPASEGLRITGLKEQSALGFQQIDAQPLGRDSDLDLVLQILELRDLAPGLFELLFEKLQLIFIQGECLAHARVGAADLAAHASGALSTRQLLFALFDLRSATLAMIVFVKSIEARRRAA
jgi:hypothetical protein